MVVRLVIAGLKWKIQMPEPILTSNILSFESGFDGDEDIDIRIGYTDSFQVDQGESITDEILDWYILEDPFYRYQLIERDDEGGSVVSLKTNANWSQGIIHLRKDDAMAIETINILLLEIVFRNRLLYFNGMIVHSSAIDHLQQAIVFAAPSGTGKTTHVGLWQEMYGVTVINDDHPAVRLIDGKAIVFGTPWAGETHQFDRVSSELKSVVILEQGLDNEIIKLDNSEIVKGFLPRCFMPYYEHQALMAALELFTRITEKVPVYKLRCRPNKDAVELVHDFFYQ